MRNHVAPAIARLFRQVGRQLHPPRRQRPSWLPHLPLFLQLPYAGAAQLGQARQSKRRFAGPGQ